MNYLAILGLAGFALIIFLSVLSFYFYEKSKVETAIELGSSSGDSETMIFRQNFKAGESELSKKRKIREAFSYIQERREHNHQQFLKIQADAIRENEELAKNEGLTNLKSKREEKASRAE